MITVGGYKFPSLLFVASDHLYFLPVKKTAEMEVQQYLCGLDDYIQQNIGMIQYIHFLIEDDEVLKEGSTIFSVETEKWLGHFVAPFPLQIVKRNQTLLEKPSLINEDCYGKGWVLQVQPTLYVKNQFMNLFHQEKLVEWIKKEIIAEKRM